MLRSEVEYPAAVEPVAFVLNIGPDGFHATAATFDRVKNGPILDAPVPEVVGVTAANNRLGWCGRTPGTDTVGVRPSPSRVIAEICNAVSTESVRRHGDAGHLT